MNLRPMNYAYFGWDFAKGAEVGHLYFYGHLKVFSLPVPLPRKSVSASKRPVTWIYCNFIIMKFSHIKFGIKLDQQLWGWVYLLFHCQPMWICITWWFTLHSGETTKFLHVGHGWEVNNMNIYPYQGGIKEFLKSPRRGKESDYSFWYNS